MPRPCKLRRVLCYLRTESFIPSGLPQGELESVSLSLDELEAIRLADLDGLYQEQAAGKMGISRQTFGNIIASAHRKIADFLINSKIMTIEGGKVEIDMCKFICGTCNHTWSVQHGSEKPSACPQCKTVEYYCAKKSIDRQNLRKCWRNV